MKALGARCGGGNLTFVVIEGDLAAPSVVEQAVLAMPNLSRSEQLAWLRQEVREIITRTNAERAAFKGPEGNAQKKDLARAESEGVFQEACRSKDLVPVRRVKSQIRTDLGFQEAARYITNALPPSLASLAKNRHEAALAAMSALSRA